MQNYCSPFQNKLLKVQLTDAWARIKTQKPIEEAEKKPEKDMNRKYGDMLVQIANGSFAQMIIITVGEISMETGKVINKLTGLVSKKIT